MKNQTVLLTLAIVFLLLTVLCGIIAVDERNYSIQSSDDLMIFELLDSPDYRLIGKSQGIFNPNVTDGSAPVQNGE